MTEKTMYKAGDYYRICDRSGFKVRASKTKKEWNGYIVRKGSWEARHPQDLVRGVADDQNVPEARPRPADVFIKLPIIQTAYAPEMSADRRIREGTTLNTVVTDNNNAVMSDNNNNITAGEAILSVPPEATTEVGSIYGVPLYTADGGLIYRAEGLGPNEVPIVTPDKYPRSW